MNKISKKDSINIFIVLMINSVIGSLLQTALTTALPAIMKDLSINTSHGQWLTTASSLAMGIMIPSTAFLLRRYKTKNLLICGMSLSMIGLFLSAIAINFEILLLGRIIQALGSGLLLAMTQVVILTIFPREKRGSMMGIYGLAVGAAPVFAPTLAGIVIDLYNWQLIFWFLLCVVTLNLVLSLFVMKNVLDNEKTSFDFISVLLSATGFSGLLICFSNIGSYSLFSVYVGLPMIIGFISLILFTIRQLRLPVPYLELRTLKNTEFRLAVILSIIMYIIMISGSILVPVYLQLVRGLSATYSGLVMMPASVIMAIISPFTGKFYDKFGIRPLAVIGSALLAIACLGVSFVNETTSIPYLIFFYIIRLIAISCVLMPIVTWSVSTLDSQFTSHGSALLTSLRTIAGSIGSALFVALMTFATNVSSTANTTSVNTTGINAAFIGISVLSLIQFFIAFFYVESTPAPEAKKIF